MTKLTNGVRSTRSSDLPILDAEPSFQIHGDMNLTNKNTKAVNKTFFFLSILEAVLKVARNFVVMNLFSKRHSRTTNPESSYALDRRLGGWRSGIKHKFGAVKTRQLSLHHFVQQQTPCKYTRFYLSSTCLHMVNQIGQPPVIQVNLMYHRDCHPCHYREVEYLPVVPMSIRRRYRKCASFVIRSVEMRISCCS